MKQFIVVTATGTPVASSPDPEEALHHAKALGPTQWLAPSSTAEPLPVADNPPGMSRPELALLKCKVPPVSRSDVERFLGKDGLKRAHAAMSPVFEEASRAARKDAAQIRSKSESDVRGLGLKLEQWLSPGSGFLTANAKLMKRDDGREGVALGLNLVPEFTVGRLRSAAGVVLKGVTPPAVVSTPGVVNFCTGSSQECRTSCLANCGQNASDILNSYVKFAKAKALLDHPVEFLAVLYASCRRYAASAGDRYPQTATKFLRLNVLSDLPWELIAPWLFDEFPAMGIQAYDYSKVPGRSHPNYDITFSYSGSNMRDVVAESAAGKRTAVVFLAPEYVKGQSAFRIAKAMSPQKIRGALEAEDKMLAGAAYSKLAKTGLAAWRAMNPLPRTFALGGREVPVVDGDYTDFRPWDPPGVVVGLRWKTPRIADPKTGKRRELRLEETPKTFVLMGEVIETKDGLVYALPHTPNNDENTDDQARAAAAALRAQLYDTERAKKIRRGRLPTAEKLAREEWERRLPPGGEL